MKTLTNSFEPWQNIHLMRTKATQNNTLKLPRCIVFRVTSQFPVLLFILLSLLLRQTCLKLIGKILSLSWNMPSKYKGLSGYSMDESGNNSFSDNAVKIDFWCTDHYTKNILSNDDCFFRLLEHAITYFILFMIVNIDILFDIWLEFIPFNWFCLYWNTATINKREGLIHNTYLYIHTFLFIQWLLSHASYVVVFLTWKI